MVGVNYDGVQGDKLTALIARMGIEFPVLTTDPRPHWGYDPPSALPMTVIIAPDGVLHKQLLGPQTQASLLAEMFPGAISHVDMASDAYDLREAALRWLRVGGLAIQPQHLQLKAGEHPALGPQAHKVVVVQQQPIQAGQTGKQAPWQGRQPIVAQQQHLQT